MQVRSKDSKHLFPLDNLLDFLHKKADITDCLKQHHLLCRIHDTCFMMKWSEEGKKKNMWRWDRYRNKDREKETGEEGETWKGEDTAWTLFHWMNTGPVLPSGLWSTPVRRPHATNLGLVTRVKRRAGSTDSSRGFSYVFLTCWGGNGMVVSVSGMSGKKRMGWGMHV